MDDSENFKKNKDNKKIQLSIIIISFNTREMTLECIESVIKSVNELKYEIIVVDNNSKDGSVEAIKNKYKQIKCIENNENFGFSKANNQGILRAKGDYLLLLNSDTIILDNAIDELYEYGVEKNKEKLTSVAPILLNEDGSLQKSFYNFPNIPKIISNSLFISAIIVKFLDKLRKLNATKYKNNYNVKIDDIKEEFQSGYVLFACVLINKYIIKEIGYLDESMHFYHEDCEFGYRMHKAKINQWITPESKIIHLGGGSSSGYSMKAYQSYFNGLLYFYKKHYKSYSYIILKYYLKAFFFASLISTVIGFKKNLIIPSNYKKSRSKIEPFASYTERIKYFSNLINIK